MLDFDSYSHCVDQHSDGLFRFAVGITRCRDSASDAVQEAFAALWEHRTKVPPDKAKSYLFTVAYREAISVLRRRKKRTTQELSPWTAAETAEWDNTSEILWRELEEMNPTARSAVLLVDWEGYSYDEVAEVLKISLSNVKVTLHRARHHLREQLNGT